MGEGTGLRLKNSQIHFGGPGLEEGRERSFILPLLECCSQCPAVMDPWSGSLGAPKPHMIGMVFSLLPPPHWLALSYPTLQIRGPMSLSLCDSFLPPWGILGKGSYRNFRAKMLTECRQTPTPLKDQFMRMSRVYRICV